MKSFNKKSARLQQLLSTLLFAGVAAGLTACGGGGGSSASTSTTNTGTGTSTGSSSGSTCKLDITGDTSLEVGKTAGLVAQSSCGGTIQEITWTQTSGEPVALIAGRSLVVSFETTTAGSIGLKAEASLSDGRTISGTRTVEFTPSSGKSLITVRSDHTVRSGTATSARAWTSMKGGETLSSISWVQTSGPTVELKNSNQNVLMITAPKVTVDTTLKFKATLNTTTTANRDSDEVTIFVEAQSARSDAIYESTERVYPYLKTGKYASVLAECTYDVNLYIASESNTNLCKASKLPFLANEIGIGNVPTVQQVMSRVLVSHDFLGANFERFLIEQDTHGDFRRLLSGVTAIVLGSHVRPSFYYGPVGAIYLDARDLWQTPEQRDVVTEVPDYRADFGSDLSYTTLTRTIKNNSYAELSYPSNQRLNRSSSELIFSLGSLLYHELAHAGDFFSPADRNLDLNGTIFSNMLPRYKSSKLISDLLAQTYPLTSQEMKGLGRVQFLGEASTEIQRAYTPTQVGNFFASDVATHDYAYSAAEGQNSREDLAMLFEEFMMTYRHGVQYDIAFTPFLTSTTPRAQFTVAWGQRGRVAVANIKPRVKLVVQRVAPWIDVSAIDNLPAPRAMKVGASWDDNLVLGGSLGASSTSAPPPSDDGRTLKDFQRHAHPHGSFKYNH